MTVNSAVAVSACEKYQRVATGWLRSGELTRTNHLLTPLEELAGFNYGFVYLVETTPAVCAVDWSEYPARRVRELQRSRASSQVPLRLRACFVGEEVDRQNLVESIQYLRAPDGTVAVSPELDEAFRSARERVLGRIRSLHLCSPQCEQFVEGLDIRLLHVWLRR